MRLLDKVKNSSLARIAENVGRDAGRVALGFAQSFAQAPQTMGRGVGRAIVAPIENRRLAKDAQTDRLLQDTLNRQASRATQSGDINRSRQLSQQADRYADRTQQNQENFASELRKSRNDVMSGTARTMLQLAGARGITPAAAASTAGVSAGAGYAIPRALGASHQESLDSAGQAAGNATTFRALNNLTNPVVNRAMSSVAPGNMLARIGAGAGANALANVAEDTAFTAASEQRLPTTQETLTSAAIGGVLGGAGQATSARQYNQAVSKARKAVQDNIERATRQATETAVGIPRSVIDVSESNRLNQSIKEFMANYDEPVSKLKRKIGVNNAAVLKRINDEVEQTGRIDPSDLNDLSDMWTAYSGSPRMAQIMSPEEMAQDLWRHARKTLDQGGFVGDIGSAKYVPEGVGKRAGVDTGPVTVTQNNARQTSQADGVMSKLPNNQSAQEFAQLANELPQTQRSSLNKAYDYLMVQTPQKLRNIMGDELYSNFEPVVERAGKIIGDSTTWQTQKNDQLVNILRENNIKIGSADDNLLYQLRDGNKGFERVSKQVGRERATQLQNAYNQLSDMYEQIGVEVNTIRQAAGLKEIPIKENFLSQVGGQKRNLVESLLNSSGSVSDEVSSSIFKKQSAPAKGGAIENASNYLDVARRAMFEDVSGKEIDDYITELSKTNASGDLIKELTNFRNRMTGAGKESNQISRVIDAVIGHRKGVSVMFNPSTIISQSFSLPQAIAEAGPLNLLAGNARSDIKKLGKESSFLKSISYTTPRELRGGGAYQQALGLSGDALQGANRVVFEGAWNGLAQKAKRMGMSDSDAVKWADKEVAEILGDRREAFMPEFYNTLLGRTVGAFTIEQTANMNRFIKNIGEKKFGTILSTLALWKIGNEVNERFGTGYDPFIDPLDTIMETAELWQGSDTTEKNRAKAMLRPFTEVLKVMPPVASGLSNAYSLGETAGILPDSSEVFADDPTWANVGSLANPLANVGRNITGNNTVDNILNVASGLVPGVNPLVARPLQAATSLNRGYAETRGGNAMYQMPENAFDQGRALLFGQSSTPQAREWFDNDFSGWLNDSQSQALERLPENQRLQFLQSAQQQNERTNRTRSQVESMLGGGKQLGSAGSVITDDTSKQGVKENKNTVQSILDAGMVVSSDDLSKTHFGGAKVNDKDFKSRKNAYVTLKKAMQDEYYTDEQKKEFLKASGATQEQYDFFEFADKNNTEKLEQLLPTLGDLSEPENFSKLAFMRASVGGSQGLSAGVIDYLYESDRISKQQQQLLKAIQYDELEGRFYIKKGSKFSGGGSGRSGGSGGKRMTYNQALKYYSGLSAPEMTQMKVEPFNVVSSLQKSGLIESILRG